MITTSTLLNPLTHVTITRAQWERQCDHQMSINNETYAIIKCLQKAKHLLIERQNKNISAVLDVNVKRCSRIEILAQG